MKFIDNRFKEFSRFIICGGINTLLTYIIYVVALRFFRYSISYSISFVSGIFIAYFLNSRFVFEQELSLKKAISYPLVYLVQYLLGITALYVLVELLSVNELLAPLIIVAITVPVTFLLSRRIIKGNEKKIPGKGL
ncbi:MAG: GtrA family protein [Syntrophomonas sp.]